MRWLKNLKPTVQLLISLGIFLIVLASYIPLSKYIKPAITSLLSSPLKLCEGVSYQAKQFARFEDLVEENKRLKDRINKLNGQLVQWQETLRENQRLRSLLSLPQRNTLRAQAALVIGKDSSNWTKTIMINRGSRDGVKCGMPVVLGAALAGKVIEAHPFVSKVALLVDFNSKTPAKIQSSREEGVVFGTFETGRNICKIKYIQEVTIGDKVISSGLGGVYPKGLLIGEVIAVGEEKDKLYKVAEIHPAIDFAGLEEVMVITNK